MEKLTPFELNYLIGCCKENRANSAALAEIPAQRWREEHRAEVAMMDALIKKLEAMKSEQ